MKRKICITLFAFIMSLMLGLSFFTVDVRASNGIAIDLGAAVGVLPIEAGGTDATTVAEFKYLFGIGTVAEEDILPIIKGGTGATIAAEARTSLGLFDATKILEKTYPVGSIYISTTNSNPQTLFGGTWEKIENRFLLGAGSTYTAGSMGGSADEIIVAHTHTISSGKAASAGSHYHSTRITHDTTSGDYQGTSDNGTTSTYSGEGETTSYQSAGAHTHTVTGTAKAAGVDGAGKNMPPYVVVNVWKRTA